jgi:hypothetical protein
MVTGEMVMDVRFSTSGGEDGVRNNWIKPRGKGRTLKDEQRQQWDDDLLAWW